MNDAPSPSQVEALSELESWKDSRSGAWAGRGFDYQYLVTVLVLLRQWAGQLSLGHLVPGGIEDCVIERSNCLVWLQAKSRKNGGFAASEVLDILDGTAARAAMIQTTEPIRSAMVLEERATGHPEAGIESLFDDAAGRVFVCQAPDQEVSAALDPPEGRARDCGGAGERPLRLGRRCFQVQLVVTL